MRFSPILLLHICAGTLGLVSGAAAMCFRKGSRWHGLAGNIFVLSMLTMSASALYLALTRHQTPNVIAGVFTFYLIATAWVTARRREGETSPLDWAGFLVAFSLGAYAVICGINAVHRHVAATNGVPTGMYFFFGSVALLGATGDVRMLVRGGVFGTQRLIRHLWRMCFGLFIATGSLFLGRPQIFPAFLRQTRVPLLLGILPLILMIFWLVRVRLNAYEKKSVITSTLV